MLLNSLSRFYLFISCSLYNYLQVKDSVLSLHYGKIYLNLEQKGEQKYDLHLTQVCLGCLGHLYYLVCGSECAFSQVRVINHQSSHD